jgi:predicted transcriptional regulator
MSYFAKERHRRLVAIIDYVKAHACTPDNLIPEIVGSFGVTEEKAQTYIDALTKLGVLKFYEKDGKITKILVKDSRKLEAMK